MYMYVSILHLHIRHMCIKCIIYRAHWSKHISSINVFQFSHIGTNKNNNNNHDKYGRKTTQFR